MNTITEITIGTKMIERTYGCPQDDRAAAGNGPLIMTPLKDRIHTVVAVGAKYITLDSGHGTKRVSRTVIEQSIYHSHTIGQTSWLSGPFELVTDSTPERDAIWQAARDTRENLDTLRYNLAQESVQ